ncbi:MAG: septum site-determining protein MinC [Vulcanimicrobiaceae bacterium]
MTLIRGRGMGIELALGEHALDESLPELEARLLERPGFYRGSSATAAFGALVPTPAQLAELRRILEGGGITLGKISGGAGVEAVAGAHGLAFAPEAAPGQELARRRALRPKRETKLSDAARSLVADFAGARADIAKRRSRGEASVPRVDPRVPGDGVAEPAPLHAIEPIPGTLFHMGTLRGGQALHHVGNIVVVGDVNPGAELVATGSIVVFGKLAGVAHAGAQGDAQARVYAVHLNATQLRISTVIAADEGNREGAAQPEAAFIRDGRIAIAPYDKLEQLTASLGS